LLLFPLDTYPHVTEMNILELAVSRGHAEILKLILAHPDCPINAPVRNGTTVLDSAACSGNLQTCRLLIAAGVDINRTSADGAGPLFVYARRCRCLCALSAN
jgi:ankyrin repeat protein